jgi:pimeloyl-ACP methyl ester carboxylesterase
MPGPIRTVDDSGARIAYELTGDGLLDVLLVPGLVSHLELDWRYPGAARLFERLGSFARLIRFDRRGVGLSQRDAAIGPLEEQVADVLAVLDDAGCGSAALIGIAEGAPLAILVAASHPDRVSALVLFGARAKGTRSEGYPWGATHEERIERARRVESEWGLDIGTESLAPESGEDLRRWIVARARSAASPAAARALILADAEMDVRDALARVDSPTLVLHRSGDKVVSSDETQYLVERIRGGRLLELPGDSHVFYSDPDRVGDEIEAFLTGVRRTAPLVQDGRIAGYRIEEPPRRGGMGAVYVAHDDRLGRRVALKVIAPELAGNEGFRERFLREWRIAASLEHPNVVPVHDAGEAGGQLYLAMRYVEGTDLKSLLAYEGKLEPSRALAIVAQVASALDAAHARGLVHRDVKPGNVLLDERAHAYLCDFGLTKDLAAAKGVTKTGQLVGTLDYIAPEQIRAEAIDGRADQYALACVLYECLAGRPPFQRESEAQMLWAHLQDEPPPVPGLPAVDPVLRRGLAKEPADRHASCSELVASAQRALGLAPAQIVAARRQRRVGRRLALSGALLLVLGAAAAIVELLR